MCARRRSSGRGATPASSPTRGTRGASARTASEQGQDSCRGQLGSCLQPHASYPVRSLPCLCCLCALLFMLCCSSCTPLLRCCSLADATMTLNAEWFIATYCNLRPPANLPSQCHLAMLLVYTGVCRESVCCASHGEHVGRMKSGVQPKAAYCWCRCGRLVKVLYGVGKRKVRLVGDDQCGPPPIWQTKNMEKDGVAG